MISETLQYCVDHNVCGKVPPEEVKVFCETDWPKENCPCLCGNQVDKNFCSSEWSKKNCSCVCDEFDATTNSK